MGTLKASLLLYYTLAPSCDEQLNLSRHIVIASSDPSSQSLVPSHTLVIAILIRPEALQWKRLEQNEGNSSSNVTLQSGMPSQCLSALTIMISESNVFDGNSFEPDISGGKIPEADISGGKIPEADISGGKIPEADTSGGKVPEADNSGGEIPEVDISRGIKIPEIIQYQ